MELWLSDLMDGCSLKKRRDSLMVLADKAAENGLKITAKDAEFIAEAEENALKEQQRVEIGGSGAAAVIADKFMGSAYVTTDNFAETVAELVDIFYEAKEESFDLLSDDELADIMFYFFEHVSEGSTELLRGRDMEELCRSIRNGGVSLE